MTIAQAQPASIRPANGTRLVLFDIDGTLLSHDGGLKYEVNTNSNNKYYYGLKKTYAIDPNPDFYRFSGNTDRYMLWEAAREQGVTREEFEAKFEALCGNLYEFFISQAVDPQMYRPIPAAQNLVRALARREDVLVGTITGNISLVADWKLNLTGVRELFSFGLCGDEADNRGKLAGLAFERARSNCGIDFAPSDITIVGDTAQDVISGKAISAHTIAVNSGGTSFADLLAQDPTLAVPSLDDPRVSAYFGL